VPFTASLKASGIVALSISPLIHLCRDNAARRKLHQILLDCDFERVSRRPLTIAAVESLNVPSGEAITVSSLEENKASLSAINLILIYIYKSVQLK